MEITVKTTAGSYNIVLERGALKKIKEIFPLKRKVLIVTDSGVPKQYAEAVAQCCAEPYVVTVPEGEASKSLDTLKILLEKMVDEGFTRTDCAVAVGGGVVGDLTGFAASCYMRGIDFYNIPTTVLSQVDSSIGGKTAIDFKGYKNIVGAFYPPKGVLIDADTLKTLPPRQISNGLSEAVKMSLTSDSELFSLFETADIEEKLEEIIYRALLIKKQVVEEDEKEAGLRKILNFGHTIAHAIESNLSFSELYHGECVAIGMLRMCSDEVKQRLIRVLEKLSLPTELKGNAYELVKAVRHDKKASGNDITVIYVPKVGEFSMKKIPLRELEDKIRQAVEK